MPAPVRSSGRARPPARPGTTPFGARRGATEGATFLRAPAPGRGGHGKQPPSILPFFLPKPAATSLRSPAGRCARASPAGTGSSALAQRDVCFPCWFFFVCSFCFVGDFVCSGFFIILFLIMMYFFGGAGALPSAGRRGCRGTARCCGTDGAEDELAGLPFVVLSAPSHTHTLTHTHLFLLHLPP